TAAPTGTPPPAADAGLPNDPCVVGESICLAKDRSRACIANGTGGRWAEETCAAGSGCFQGKCTASKCSDECTLGEKQTVSGTLKTCAPFSIATGKPATSDPAAKMHDRARGYLARMRTESF